jgi:hypothetical protein
LLKGFLEKIGTDGLEVVADEIAQPEMLFDSEVLAAAEQQPTGLLQDRGQALAFHAAGFRCGAANLHTRSGALLYKLVIQQTHEATISCVCQ